MGIKKIIIFILLGLIVILLGLGVARKLSGQSFLPSFFPNKDQTAPNQQLSEHEKAVKAANDNWLTQTAKQQAVDHDLDDLSDEDEKKIGTDINKEDTDSDGLLDGQEVQIFKTNPLKADTDGDGVKDGLEVARGQNPLGKGKLEIVKKQIVPATPPVVDSVVSTTTIKNN